MCRTCTTDSSSQLQPLFDDPNLSKQLQEYAGVSVKPADGLPDQICTACIENLHLVHTFLSGCKRADEHLRNVVRRTMSSRNSFQSLSMEQPSTPNGTQLKAGTEARIRKQIISERRHSNIQQKKRCGTQSSKSLITTARIKETPMSEATETHQITVENELIHSEDCISEELELLQQDPISQTKSTESYEKSGDDYLLVLSPSQDNEDTEYIITDVGENHYNEDDEDEGQIENDDYEAKHLNTSKTEIDEHLNESDNSSVKMEREQMQDATALSIDLGAVCEAANFPRHSCSMCGNSFPNQTQLKSHMRTHGTEKYYACELCNKRFNAACNLTTHMRTHTGEKPYICAYCCRRFADRSTHRKHERMHTNERPYACNICAKTFSLSTTLKAHFLSHSQEKPHKCFTCNKGFRLPHQLKAHQKSHVHRYEAGIMQYNQED
ncbi:hypothetical protein ACLKA6_016445 [Drosophila palustris]